MSIIEKIKQFVTEMGYLDNDHVLGILFYGSSLTGLNTSNSDIDLHIIFDDEDKDHLIRGNKIVDGTRIEYFEKPLSEIYQAVDENFQDKNNAPLSIFGTSKIIYAKDDSLNNLQAYVIEKFSNPLPRLTIDEAREQVSILNNRMERLKRYAETDSPYFEHLYHLTIDKIRRFYHNYLGVPRIEASKCFNIYTKESFRRAFGIINIPEQEFIALYFEALSDSDLSKREKYQLLSKIYAFTTRNIFLNDAEHRIPIKSRNLGFDYPIVKIPATKSKSSSAIDPTVLKTVNDFIKVMGYKKNKHCLGVFIYGSSLTGFNTPDSDIDLHVLFDDTDPNHLIRGSKVVNGTKIEYFEKPIDDVYLSVENDYQNQNNACYSLFGKGAIVFERNKELSSLQQYVLNRFKTPLPKLSEEECKEQTSIISNRLEKLERLAANDDPKFDHLYHLCLDKIRKFYHRHLGISKIQTSKVYRIYTDRAYRESMYKENPDQFFVDMYLSLIDSKEQDKKTKYASIKTLFDYTTRNIHLGDDYRISIKSRNTNLNPHNNQSQETPKQKVYTRIKHDSYY